VCSSDLSYKPGKREGDLVEDEQQTQMNCVVKINAIYYAYPTIFVVKLIH
jgi:hypothetical protein